MKPTTDEMLAWAQEAGWMKVLWKDQYADGTDCIKKLAALAYAAGAAAMKERAAKVCADLWCKEPEPGDARDCYDAIRALGDDDE